MEKRSKGNKLIVKGCLPGAKVVRGADWDWDNQDGKFAKKYQLTLCLYCKLAVYHVGVLF